VSAKHILEREHTFYAEGVEHFHGLFGLRMENSVRWQLALLAAFTIIVPEPFFRDEEPLVDKGVPVFRHVSGKNPYLATVNFSDCPAVLASDTDRVLPFLDKTAFVKDQGAIWAAEIITNQTTILGHNPVIVPRCVADKPLQCPDVSVFQSECDRFNGFAFQVAELPGHVVEKVLPRFASLKALGELLVESSEFVPEICNIAFVQIKFGNRVEVVFISDAW
jgi:hypothetical protein